MAGDKMEDLLLGGDDSSSGESDTEQPPRAPVPAAVAPAASSAAMSQSEMAQRLKSLYSPASKAASGAPAPVPMAAPAAPKPSLPPQQHMTTSRPSSSSSSAVQQQQQMRGIMHPQQMAQQQPRPSHPSQQPQSLQLRTSSGGMSMQPQQTVPNMTTHSDPQQRPSTHSMPSVSAMPQQQQHRPTSRLPHQQSVRPPQQQHSLPPQQVKNMPPQQQQSRPQPTPQQMAPPQRTNNMYGTTTSGGGSTPQQPMPLQQQIPASSAMDRAVLEKKQKERFLVFTRVLMKYLEQKDAPLHLKVKAIIKDCADRNRRKEPGYESVTAAMRVQLRKAVGDVYWKKAEAYLKHFLEEKARPAGAPGAAPNAAPPAGSSSQRTPAEMQMLMQQQQQQRSQEAQRNQATDANKGGMSMMRVDDPSKKQRQPVALSTTSTKNIAQAKPTAAMYQQAAKEKSAPKGRVAKGASTPTSQQQRKLSLSTMTTTDTTAPSSLMASVSAAPAPLIDQEYNELMEHIDHAFNFDWTVAGSILGESMYTTLDEEQKRLVMDAKGTTPASDRNEPLPEGISFPLEGWSQRNVISSRVAWARLRLTRNKVPPAGSTPTNPVVGGGLLGIPHVPGKKMITIENAGTPAESAKAPEPAVWYNEEKAEEDAALAVLSEGAEIYLKTVLEKALHCARQRQNLDGTRLWYQQYTKPDEAKPALSLRLGCDVPRQMAQVAGNAAMTCKRMEEARERQSNIPTRDIVFSNETLSQATSMSDLALRPKLGHAVADAKAAGQRHFEVYGGKHARNAPPLGRVAKQAKLEVVDFQTGMAFAPSKRGRRHQAATTSSSFSF